MTDLRGKRPTHRRCYFCYTCSRTFFGDVAVSAPAVQRPRCSRCDQDPNHPYDGRWLPLPGFDLPLPPSRIPT